MSLHPQVAQFLAAIEAMGGPALVDLDPPAAREQFGQLALLTPSPETVASTREVRITIGGGDIGARLYLPESAAPHPVLVWYHGGGWVIGDLDTADTSASSLCTRAGVAVLSVDYRLAPEHRHPAAVDDAVGALRWVLSGADGTEELNPDRVAVGGDSAGGNLSAVVAQWARDEGVSLAHQLLVYPVTDCTRTSASYDENAEGYLLTAEGMAWFCDHYLGDQDPEQPSASPLFADDLSGLAPATVITAEFDPLRDEGEAYAAALADAGVEVLVRRFDGQIHGFFAMEGLLDDARVAVDWAAERLCGALA